MGVAPFCFMATLRNQWRAEDYKKGIVWRKPVRLIFSGNELRKLRAAFLKNGKSSPSGK